jgi:hypothetical protein
MISSEEKAIVFLIASIRFSSIGFETKEKARIQSIQSPSLFIKTSPLVKKKLASSMLFSYRDKTPTYRRSNYYL